MMESIYVICFYWEGDRWKSEGNTTMPTDPSYQGILRRAGRVSLKLASQYVNNLYWGVERWASRPFKFVCFTNEPLEVVKSVELRRFPLHTTAGVLPRVYMFSPGAGLENRQVLCLDLDVIVVGDLSPLMNYEGLFCARSKFKPGETWKLDGDVMSFRAGEEAQRIFWDPFIEDVDAAVKMTQGRERYWIRHVANDIADRWDKVAPGAVISYKWHARSPELPKDAAVVSCHGYPRPHQVNKQWVKKYWK